MLKPLGKLTTTAGTRKALVTYSANQQSYTRKVVVRALSTNTQAVTVGDSTVVASTGVGAADILAPGTQTVIEVPPGGNANLDPGAIYFDVAVSAEGVVAYFV